MFTFAYKSTQIVVPEKRYRPLVEAWFDDLEEKEVKQAVRRIKWREMRPQKQHFKLQIWDFIDSDPLGVADEYTVLEEAADLFRQALAQAIEGREQEVAEMINSFLSELPVPDGPWREDLEDRGDWWKRD